ncbi:formylglycine-generating enzyme family protein [bacterium]|nr:formylglycine-generating enzyme family protein [bacterium]
MIFTAARCRSPGILAMKRAGAKDYALLLVFTASSVALGAWLAKKNDASRNGLPVGMTRDEKGELLWEKDGAPMALVSEGPFVMGAETTSSTEDAEAMPAHEERTEAFFIDRFEVTNGRYARFLSSIARVGHVLCPGDEPREKDHRPLDWGTAAYTERSAGDDRPVAGVDWHDARAYAAWAGKRLPTEVEWEKAARGTDARPFPWGTSQPRSRGASGVSSRDELGVFRANWRDDADGFLYAAPVGSFPDGASPWGCQDMAGNVWEWTESAFDLYPGAPAFLEARYPRATRSRERVFRGGSFDQSTMDLQTTHRHHAPPETRRIDFGFRCAVSAWP